MDPPAGSGNNGDDDDSNNNTGAPTNLQQKRESDMTHLFNLQKVLMGLTPAQKRQMYLQSQPIVKDQLVRILPTLSVPATRNDLRVLLDCVLMNNGPLSDEKTRQLFEDLRSADSDARQVSAIAHLTAVYFTWRGRHTFRFPWYTPSPAWRQSMNSSPTRRLLCNPLRYAAYSLIVFPTLQLPLSRFVFGVKAAQVEASVMSGVNPDYGAYRPSREQAATQYRGQPEKQSIREAAQSEWDSNKESSTSEQWSGGWPDDAQSASTSQQQQRQQQQQRTQQVSGTPTNSDQNTDHSRWESPDIDDASPVAPPMQGQSSKNGGSSGSSAWDRIRQQSLSSESRQSRQRRSQPEPAASGGWGGRGEDAAESAEREKAQREFDQLVEQDKNGGKERGPWDNR